MRFQNILLDCYTLKKWGVVLGEGDLDFVQFARRNQLTKNLHKLPGDGFPLLRINAELVGYTVGELEAFTLLAFLGGDFADHVEQGTGQLRTHVIGGVASQVPGEGVKKRPRDIEHLTFGQNAKFGLGLVDKFRVLHNVDRSNRLCSINPGKSLLFTVCCLLLLRARFSRMQSNRRQQTED